LPNEPDEAIQLTNVAGLTVGLQDWTLSDGEGTVTLVGSLDPGSSAWIANRAASFTLEFGFAPDYEYGADTDPNVSNLARAGSLALGNAGDELLLRDGGGLPVDTVVWENGAITTTGWSGASVWPYLAGLMIRWHTRTDENGAYSKPTAGGKVEPHWCREPE
jgi:hypothetical protein